MNVQAVAVCLIHAYANPAHERRVAEILRDELPGMAVTVSSDVLPVVREYERSLTTVLNATVMPGVTTYVRNLEKRLDEEGATPPLMLMQSNGGVAGAPKIRVAPALTALSARRRASSAPALRRRPAASRTSLRMISAARRPISASSRAARSASPSTAPSATGRWPCPWST